MEAFEKLENVGEGTYGKVYRARERVTGKIVALKKTRLHEDDEGVPPTTLCDISILRMLSRDPHVVRLMDVKQGQNKEGKTVLYLVFEYMDTDLKKEIRSFRQTGDSIPVNIVKSLIKTMALKIADLGLGRAFTLPIKKYTHEILTLWYRAPEVILGATHYSIGVAIDHFKMNLGGSDAILPDLRFTINVSGSGVGYGQGRINTLKPPFRKPPPKKKVGTVPVFDPPSAARGGRKFLNHTKITPSPS
ncbi:Cyclin-dependent kinase B2-1 [Hibiscus syriacus]|uniref:Cyclin-dependent kinase B2-1 n=1 Tax=Hibiscus syriacus TaxID=106335 RepID=A0A6A2ZE45_HIBSY|nr:Cyclin-dependent kinase B2-1 [Hibiscus syriacus]